MFVLDKRTIDLILFTVLLTGCVTLSTQRVGKKGITKVFIAKRIEEPIHIDGVLNEKVWKKAQIITPFWKGWENRPAEIQSKGKILWDREYLYIGIEMEDRDIYGLKEGDDVQTTNDDVIEVFIKPKEDVPHYYEFHVTPKNATRDLMYAKRGAGPPERWISFNSGMKSAVRIRGTLNNWKDKDEGWSVEIAIPFSCFKDTCSPPQAGEEWRFALCRYNYSVYLDVFHKGCSVGMEYSSSAYLPQLNFHLYENYNILRFSSDIKGKNNS